MSYMFQYRAEIDLQRIVDEQARKLQRLVDEATLDKAADTLANFGYVKADGRSRWLELFGTPERAARVIVALNNCRVVCCEDCAARGACKYDGCGDDYDALLEWLRGDADA